MTNRHHQTGNDGIGHYEARADFGQGLTMGRSVDIVATVSPAVYWVPEEGRPVRAWQGDSYRQHRTSKRKSEQSVMFLARKKCEVLRNYYKLNGRRWELVVDEERAERKATERAVEAAAQQVRRTAPRLLAALRKLHHVALEDFKAGSDEREAVRAACREAVEAIAEAETVRSPETLEEARARRAGVKS